MINYKSPKVGFGVVMSLVLGLSGCEMFSPQRPQMEPVSIYEGKTSTHKTHNINNTQNTQNTHNIKKKVTSSQQQPAQKGYASKDPTQKSTPGPIHKAAPQIPVIQ